MNDATTPEKAAQENAVIYLNEGETKFLKQYNSKITFKTISEDSRCPKGLNCIWAGVAVAQVEIIDNTAKPHVISLATLENSPRNYRQSADFKGYTITLKDVTPYPDSKQSLSVLRGKYKIAVVIAKAKNNAVPTTK